MRMTTFMPALAALCAALYCGCASEEEKRPCPPGGIGVADHEGKTIIEQIAEYDKYACAKAQICPDQGGQAGAFPIGSSTAAGEASFLLTNCSTGKEKLEITQVELYGDDRCFFTEVTDSDIKDKVILPGESTAVRTTYDPTDPGEDHAELRVHSNAENYPVLRLRVCSYAYVETPEPEPGPDPQQGDGGAAVPDAGAGTQDSLPALECKAKENKRACP